MALKAGSIELPSCMEIVISLTFLERYLQTFTSINGHDVDDCKHEGTWQQRRD